MNSYGEWLRGKGFAARTIDEREGFYRTRHNEWQLEDVQAATVAAWLAGYTGWSRRTYHSHLTSIFDWMVETGQRADNPARMIRRSPAPGNRPTPLSEHDLSRVLAAADSRTRAFLMLGYLAGLRRSEIAKFHGRDLDVFQVRVVGKGGSCESLPTHPLLWDLAQQYPRDGYWFPGRMGEPHISGEWVGFLVGRLFRSLGITGATHRTRHTYGTQLLRNGANLRVVQELMRHRSLATTAAYLGVDEAERQTAIRSLVA